MADFGHDHYTYIGGQRMQVGMTRTIRPGAGETGEAFRRRVADLVQPLLATGGTLPAPAVLLNLLRTARTVQFAVRVKRANTWKDNDLVFCARDGQPLWPRSVADEWYALRDAAGLPDTTKLHHLRHSLATLLDESGASEALKAGILGHETRSVTQRYTHARLAAMRTVLETVAEKVAQAA